MVGVLLVRGMLVGILAGVLASAFAYLFGESSIDLAIAFERHISKAADEPELVSRAIQGTIGLLTGLVVFGAAIGGIFGLAFAFAQGRLGQFTPRGTAALLAATGFVVLVLIPQIKYPASPPSVGSPETIGARTGLYFALLALSIMVGVAALGFGRRLVDRFGAWNAVMIGIVTYLAAMAVVMHVLPSIDEVPDQFSAALLWRFRIAAIGTQAVLWTTLGFAFGTLTERSGTRSFRPVVGRTRK